MHGVKIKTCKIVKTKDHDGGNNGNIIEIVNIWEPFLKATPKIEQAYITTCNPGQHKGLHVHQKKEDRFCVIKGEATIALYTPGDMEKITLSEKKPQVIIIPPGVGHGIKCVGDTPCWILNCPSRAYAEGSPDQIEIKMQW